MKKLALVLTQTLLVTFSAAPAIATTYDCKQESLAPRAYYGPEESVDDLNKTDNRRDAATLRTNGPVLRFEVIDRAITYILPDGGRRKLPCLQLSAAGKAFREDTTKMLDIIAIGDAEYRTCDKVDLRVLPRTSLFASEVGRHVPAAGPPE